MLYHSGSRHGSMPRLQKRGGCDPTAKQPRRTKYDNGPLDCDRNQQVDILRTLTIISWKGAHKRPLRIPPSLDAVWKPATRVTCIPYAPANNVSCDRPSLSAPLPRSRHQADAPPPPSSEYFASLPFHTTRRLHLVHVGVCYQRSELRASAQRGWQKHTSMRASQP